MKKIAIITGATGGIGKEFAACMVKEEVDEVWAIARNKEKLEQLRDNLGKKIVPVAVDLTSFEQIKGLGTRLEEEKPIISYLVNDAGIGKMASYEQFSLEEISQNIDINCKALALMCKLCIPYMTKGSRILNISSAASFQPTPYINLYAASKAFERSYSRALNVELKGTGITSTAVCPSWVDTDLIQRERNGLKVKFPGIVTAAAVVKKAMKDAKKGKDMSVCSFYVKCQHFNVKIFPQKWSMRVWMKGVRKYL